MTDDEITAALKRLREQVGPDPWPDERVLGWIRHEIGDVAWANPIIHAAIMRGLMDRQTRETILASAVRIAGEALFHQQQMMMRLLEAKPPEPMVVPVGPHKPGAMDSVSFCGLWSPLDNWHRRAMEAGMALDRAVAAEPLTPAPSPEEPQECGHGNPSNDCDACSDDDPAQPITHSDWEP